MLNLDLYASDRIEYRIPYLNTTQFFWEAYDVRIMFMQIKAAGFAKNLARIEQQFFAGMITWEEQDAAWRELWTRTNIIQASRHMGKVK